jgi:hypothetical protein
MASVTIAVVVSLLVITVNNCDSDTAGVGIASV